MEKIRLTSLAEHESGLSLAKVTNKSEMRGLRYFVNISNVLQSRLNKKIVLEIATIIATLKENKTETSWAVQIFTC